MNPRLALGTRLGGAGLGLALVATVHGAVAPVPKLDSASLVYLQRGTTNRVTLNGDGLGQLDRLWASHVGVRVSAVASPSGAVSLEGSAGGIAVRAAEPAKARAIDVVVGADVPLGSHEVRVAGPGGVSNPVAFQVSDHPEILEPSGTGSASSAPALSLPVGVSGKIGGSAEADHYRLALKSGEVAVLDVQANRTGSSLDGTLMVLDGSGKELARSEDAHGLDPFIVFKAPSDGTFIVRLSDLRHQGGDRHTYRLVARSGPYVETLFPFGGQRGTTVEVALQGHLLEGADRLVLSLAPDAPTGRQDVRARTRAGFSNPVGFEVGNLPEVLEAEPNDAPDKATPATGPVVFNGRVGKAGDVDHLRFKSPADQRWVAEVFARRFGSPLDVLLTLQDAQGKVLQRNDDANGPDARIEFDAKKDVEYVLSVRDLTDRGGEAFGYRLTVQRPDVAAGFSARSGAGRVRLHQGGWVALRCDVSRRNGHDGTVRFEGRDLPMGVSAMPMVAGPGAEGGWVMLGASESAATGSTRLRLVASGEVGGKATMQDVALAEQGWLTVLPAAPFSVDVGQGSVVVEQNGRAELDVALARAPGFEGEVRVVAEGVPGLNVAPLVLKGGATRGKLALNAAYNAAGGTRPMLVRAEATVEGQALVQAAPRIVEVTVRDIPLFATAMLPGSPFFRLDPVRLSAVALPTNSASAANRTEFVVKVERRGYEGEVTLALEGVPTGVLATVQPVAAKAREATVQLVVTDKAEAGKEHKLGVALRFEHGDRIWRQKTEPVTLTVAAPAVETASTNAPATAKPN